MEKYCPKCFTKYPHSAKRLATRIEARLKLATEGSGGGIVLIFPDLNRRR